MNKKIYYFLSTILVVVIGFLTLIIKFSNDNFKVNKDHNYNYKLESEFKIQIINQYKIAVSDTSIFGYFIKPNLEEQHNTLHKILYHHNFPFSFYEPISKVILNKQIDYAYELKLTPAHDFVAFIAANSVTSKDLENINLPINLIKGTIDILHSYENNKSNQVSAYLGSKHQKYFEIMKKFIIL